MPREVLFIFFGQYGKIKIRKLSFNSLRKFSSLLQNTGPGWFLKKLLFLLVSEQAYAEEAQTQEHVLLGHAGLVYVLQHVLAEAEKSNPIFKLLSAK
jgi:hypothetical protein